MNEQINSIKNKLEQLKQLDKNYRLFGANKHKYKLNPTISLDKIRQFESAHKVILPTDYVEFLTNIGNGGAGPFYGLEPIEDSLFDDLHYKNPDSLLNPSKPFLHSEPWKLKFQPSVDPDENEEEYQRELDKFEDKYFDNEQLNGVLAICNYGCAVSLNLVVNGKEYGYIWTDDRGSENGIYPSYELGNEETITFLNWYELWLDNSIIKATLLAQNEQIKIEQSNRLLKKSWWKLW